MFSESETPITYTLLYLVDGMQGTLSGQSSQIVPAGGDGTEVTAIPSAGFRFIRWSDGVTTASRTDTDVTADLTVTAEFEAVAPVVTYEVTATVDGTAVQSEQTGTRWQPVIKS